jgi:formylglycine-generating enzyme required for sulfatase activity
VTMAAASPSPSSSDAAVRLGAMLAGHLDERRDFAWLASPNGLVAVCRSALQGDSQHVLRDSSLEELLVLLDDYLPHLAGHRASDRARALVAVSTGRSDLAELEFGSAEAVGVIERMLSGTVPRATAEVTASALTSRHADGQVVDLVMTLVPGPNVVLPDVRVAPMLRCDEAFVAAIRAAVDVAGLTGRGTVLWAAFSQRTRAPLDVIVGPSVGLAAALAARRLARPDLPALDPSWAFTGGIDRRGRIVSLLDASADTTAYLAKLTAAGDRSVVVPAADIDAVGEVAHANSLPARVLGAATVDEAETVLTRHLAGKIGWERALAGRPVDPNARRKVGLAIAAAVVPLSLVLLAGNWLRHKWDVNKLREAARGPTAPIAGPNGTFFLFRAEVSWKQYRLCMKAGKCTPPLVSGRPVDTGDPALDPLPVEGVTWNQAKSFCDWQRAALPTFGQWQAAVLDRATEWPMQPKSPGAGIKERAAIPEVRREPFGKPLVPTRVPGRDEVAHLIDNVAEWTRTICSPRGDCPDVAVDDALPLGSARTVGITSILATNVNYLDDGDITWLQKPNRAEDYRAPNDSVPNLGFRCVSTKGFT